jgi:hypothetical protein
METKHGLIAFGATLLLASPAAFAAQRTFVATSGTGNPACSLVAPCRSFADAIVATNVGGEIVVLDSGGYGPVTITKSVSVISPPGIYAGISVFAGNDGVDVDAPGATVVLRGLSINGQGGAHGVLIKQAARVRIENCVISNMSSVGIYHQADNGETIVVDTIVRDNQDGLGLVAADAAITLDRVRSEHNNSAGFYIAPVPGAMRAHATITNSLFAENGGHGVWVDTVASAYTYARVHDSAFSRNGGDGFRATAAAGGANAYTHLSRNLFTDNGNNIYGLGVLPGIVSIWALDNSINGFGAFTVDGSGASTVVARNGGATSIFCANGGRIFTAGNNEVTSLGPPGCVTPGSPG